MKGCVMPIVDDKITLLAKKGCEMASDVSNASRFLTKPLNISGHLSFPLENQGDNVKYL